MHKVKGFNYNVPTKSSHIIPYFIANSQMNYLLYFVLMEIGVSVKIASIIAIIL